MQRADENKPKWRFAPTKREEEQWARAKKAVSGGTVCCLCPPFLFCVVIENISTANISRNDSYQEGQYDIPQLSHDNLCTGHKGLNVGVVQERLLQEVNRERKDPVKEAAAARERYLKVSIFSPVSNIMVCDCCRSACLCGGIPIHNEVAIWLLSSSYSYWLFLQPTC